MSEDYSPPCSLFPTDARLQAYGKYLDGLHSLFRSVQTFSARLHHDTYLELNHTHFLRISNIRIFTQTTFFFQELHLVKQTPTWVLLETILVVL